MDPSAYGLNAHAQKSERGLLSDNDSGRAGTPAKEHLNMTAAPLTSSSTRRIGKGHIWIALLALAAALGSLVASSLVLVTSHHKPQGSWLIQPSVVLGFLAPLGAFCLDYAHKEAATVSWWLKLADGDSVYNLHREWAVGQSFWDAVTFFSPKVSAKTAISTLSLILYIAVGPLLQQASTVQLLRADTPVMLNSSFALNLPGSWSTTTNQTLANHAGAISPEMLDIVLGYTSRDPIPTNVSGCDGTCIGTVSAWGLNGTCQDISTSSHDWAKDYFLNGVRDPATLFNISFPAILLSSKNGTILDSEAIPQIQFTVTYWTPENATYNPPANSSVDRGIYQYCPGTLRTKQCTYFVDFVDYPVSMTNTSIQLNSTNAYFGPPQRTGTHFSKGTFTVDGLSGLQVAARNLFSSTARISNPGIIFRPTKNPDETTRWASWDLDAVGTFASKYAHFNYSESGSCFQSYGDPTDEITHGLSDILLRTSVSAAQFLNQTNFVRAYQQNITARQIKTELVFVSHYGYFAGGAAVMLVVLVLVSLPLWGWWRLNRAVTMSPLETAIVLKDQIHVHGHVNFVGDDLAELIGHHRVRSKAALRGAGDGEIELSEHGRAI